MLKSGENNGENNGEEEEDEGQKEEKEEENIKSNNPHPTSREKNIKNIMSSPPTSSHFLF